MKAEPLPKMKSTMSDGPEGRTFVIPPRKNRFLIAFLGIWLVGWAAGDAFVCQSIGRNSTPYLIQWIFFWSIGGSLFFIYWLWMVFGQERVVINQEAIVHRYVLFGMSRSRKFPVTHIRNLRASPPALSYWNSGASFYGFGSGVVAFDYGAKTIRMGDSLDEAEGRTIVRQMQEVLTIPNS
jgi:hypothetical protein